MPPWKPEPGYGNFDHERRLTDEQIAQIQEWAATGAPEGDAADKPVVPTFPSGWQAGEPDQVLKMSAPYTLTADGPDQFRCFVLPMNLAKESYVSGAEFRPGNPRVVHHALIFLDSTGTARKLAAASGGAAIHASADRDSPARACWWAGLPDTLPCPRNRRSRNRCGRARTW